MKKTFTIAALALATLTASAQTDNTPNRMILQTKVGDKAYAIDKVDSIYFARQDGNVVATVEYKNYSTGATGDTLWVAVTRSGEDVGYCIDVLPTNTAKKYDDDTMAKYFEQKNAQKFYQDFTNAQLTGVEGIKPNTSYTIVTLAYDGYGVPCETSRAEFTTPKAQLVGNPGVTYTVDDVKGTEFTLTVTPNADCKAFYWCEFGKGEAQSQFEQWGPMFGLANMEDMIKQFSGNAYDNAATNTWNGLKPSTDYEVYVVPTDANGNYGEMVVIPVTTAKMGGEGVAQTTITVGKMGGNALDGFYLPVTYTPNDQTSLHHDLLVSKAYYDESIGSEDKMKEILMSDTNPFNPWDSYWDQIGEDAANWTVEPNTEYYAVSMAKNANGEWGPLAMVHTNTNQSAKSADAQCKAASVATRIVKTGTKAVKTGVVPVMKQQGLKLEMAK